MLSWPDTLCERLAAGGRRVVRYDLRDSGESTTTDPEAPAYTLRDLAADAAALAGALGGGPAHLAGIGVGGMVAQVAVLDHPGAFSALTLAGTRAVAPGPPDADLPDHDQATMGRLLRASDARLGRPPRGGGGFRHSRRRILGDDPAAARAIAARSWDRTPGTAPPGPAGQSARPWCFPGSTASPAGASNLPEITVPALVVHGRRNRFFPVGNGEAIAREIPGARLLVLEEAATAIPAATAGGSPRRSRTRIEDGGCRAGLASTQQWTSKGRLSATSIRPRAQHTGTHPRLPEPTGGDFDVEQIWIFPGYRPPKISWPSR